MTDTTALPELTPELLLRCGMAAAKLMRTDCEDGAPLRAALEVYREEAIRALRQGGEAVAWRAVPTNGGRSPQTTWIAMPVSQWAFADVKAGVCTIEYAYVLPTPPAKEHPND